MAGHVGIRLLFYQELQDGDRRKVRAESNDAVTGGGARDLRIRPQDRFEPFIADLIPTTQQRHTRARGTFEVRFEKVRWNRGGRVEIKDLEIWPPTEAREGELRIRSIDKNFPDSIPTSGGRAFVVIVRNDHGELWAYYVTEQELRGGKWNAAIADPILNCVDRTQKTTVRGFVDYDRHRVYCHE